MGEVAGWREPFWRLRRWCCRLRLLREVCHKLYGMTRSTFCASCQRSLQRTPGANCIYGQFLGSCSSSRITRSTYRRGRIGRISEAGIRGALPIVRRERSVNRNGDVHQQQRAMQAKPSLQQLIGKVASVRTVHVWRHCCLEREGARLQQFASYLDVRLVTLTANLLAYWVHSMS